MVIIHLLNGMILQVDIQCQWIFQVPVIGWLYTTYHPLQEPEKSIDNGKDECFQQTWSTLPGWGSIAWMSQEVSKWLVNGLFNLLVNGEQIRVITYWS